jgi:site-specific DNA recombinase
MSKRAAVYARISQDRAGAGLGVERQRQDCLGLAKRLGWVIVSEHTDNDMSAYSGKPRPGYRALLDEIGAGEVDAVLAWHEDRLHRSPRELEDYIDVCAKHSVVTHFAQAGELDLVTASGRMTARIRGAVSRQESEHKSERTKRAQLQAAQAGRWRGGAPPFGWNLQGDGSATLNRREAREIRDAAGALLAGASLGSLVTDLNRRGITTSAGNRWTYTSLRQVLMRPRNAGLSVLNGETVGRTTWPVILQEETWRAVCALLGDSSRRRSTSNRAKWLLAGIAVCGKDGCGQPLRSATAVSNRARGTTRTVYRCPVGGGGHVARSAHDVDDLVTGVVLQLLARPDWSQVLRSNENGQDGEGLRVEAVALRGRLGEAADQFADGAITGSQLAKITLRVNERLADVEAAMAQTARGTALAPFAGGDPERVWSALSVDRRRAVVRELMSVTVLPSGKRGNGFDPGLVRIDWKGTAQ